MRRFYILILILALFTSCSKCKNGQSSIDCKVDSLLQLMTFEEKIGQLNQIDAGYVSPEIKAGITSGSIGSLLNCPAQNVNEVQHLAVDSTRFGIPLLIARDVIHGYKTIFPIPLAQACSWDTAAVALCGKVSALEAIADGIKYTFTPMIDVTHDPRWGRIAEGYGEDSYLTSVMGVAMIKGLQGSDLADGKHIAACAKHFAGYGLTESGRDYNVANTSEERLRNWILPPFKAAAEAGVATFMAGFNELNGVPVSGNKYLLKDILRNEWNYDGMVISDYFSIEQMFVENYTPTRGDAAREGINAGVDMDMMGHVYINHLDSLVKAGAVSMETIDSAVRNVLKLKFKLGLFDNPYIDDSNLGSTHYSPDALNAALKVAEESVVLVKNDSVLPLDASKIKRILVTGPLANAPYEQMGTWCFDGDKTHSVTPLAAIKEQYGDSVDIVFEPTLDFSRSTDLDGVERAVKAASKADVILAFVGEEAILSGEAKCRADISLPGVQNELVKKLADTGKPLVMVVMAGRPLTIGEQMEQADATLIAFHGGTMAGKALSNIIFGRTVPSGKLPVTFPKMVGQIPIYYNDYKTGRPADYRPTLLNEIPVEARQTSLGFCTYHLDAGVGPLMEFGYGLSYTTFNYSPVELSKTEIGVNDTIVAKCTITNTGSYDGTEIVQLYIHDKFASLVRPVKELKGFKRVMIPKGESVTVEFPITAKDLSFYNNSSELVCEPGEFEVWIASSSRLNDNGKIFTLK